MPVEVKWERTDQCYWHELMKLDFSYPEFKRLHGIFIIWHGGPNPKVLFIGQGDIPTKLDILFVFRLELLVFQMQLEILISQYYAFPFALLSLLFFL